MEKDLQIRISISANQVLIVLACLFVIVVGVVSYFVTLAMSPHHSGLTFMPAFERIGSWCAVVLVILALIWAIYRRKKWRGTVVRLWRSIQTRVLRRTPRSDLSEMRDQIYTLGLALHGVTPEEEVFRRTHFQMHGENVPFLILPVQDRELYTEFVALKKMLEHYGFPSVKHVRMQPKTFAFVQRWVMGLEARLQTSNQDALSQQQKTQQALAAVLQLHQMIGQRYAIALSEPGYLRLHGAVKLLQRIAQDHQVSGAIIQRCAFRLQQDMEALVQELQRKVV